MTAEEPHHRACRQSDGPSHPAHVGDGPEEPHHRAARQRARGEWVPSDGLDDAATLTRRMATLPRPVAS